MGVFNYLAGLSENFATLSTTTITASSEDSNFDADNVGTGWPAQPFRFNAAASGDTLSFDFGSAKTPTFVSIHGHNIDSGVTSIDILSDDNSGFSSPVTERNITFANLVSPTHFELLPSYTSHRYMRLLFNGTNTAAPIEIGEIGVGIKKTLTAKVIDFELKDDMPQHRKTGGSVVQPIPSNLSTHPQRSGVLRLFAKTFAARREIQDELRVGTSFGEEPLICVPDADDNIVLHARVPATISWERIGDLFFTNILLQEDPFSIKLP
jgi:hypothetical protein